MTDAERAERAADLADRRARDADRISRWMIGIGLALIAAVLITLLDVRSDVNALAREQAVTAAQVREIAEVQDAVRADILRLAQAVIAAAAAEEPPD